MKWHDLRIAIIVLWKEGCVKCNSLMQKKIQLRLSDLLILSSYPVSSVLTQKALHGDIMDYQTSIGLFGVLCGLFWLIIFFCCLGPLLVWCGWARIDDLDDFEIPADLRALVRRKSYMTRHQQIRKRRRRNTSI